MIHPVDRCTERHILCDHCRHRRATRIIAGGFGELFLCFVCLVAFKP